MMKKYAGQDKDMEISHQVLLQAKQTLGKMNLISANEIWNRMRKIYKTN